ncbi:MAG: NAD(+)/NADH kinase [Candidatus Caenarcaniphilales bacterium]|jgi:NAD+ kinase|nr:NAD(+)/NADH kinase [Candidatus Caenarcaniphilales bacterium]
MSQIVIFYNPLKEEAAKTAQGLKLLLEQAANTVTIFPTKRSSEDWQILTKDVDLAIALGGDGTLLLTSKQALRYGVPLLGVNFGHLGFLSEYGGSPVEELAKEIIAKNFLIEDRGVLEARVPEQNIRVLAVNDIAVNRSLSSNLLHTDLYIDNDLLHSFRSDGIIICTPTGSTAYALSAGGAVMDPNIHAFQIVPIAAHSLNSRAHVISDTQIIELVSRKDINAPFVMQADGQELITLDPGSKIIINKAREELRLVKLKKHYRSFYSILRDKMKWGSLIN